MYSGPASCVCVVGPLAAARPGIYTLATGNPLSRSVVKGAEHVRVAGQKMQESFRAKPGLYTAQALGNLVRVRVALCFRGRELDGVVAC